MLLVQPFTLTLKSKIDFDHDPESIDELDLWPQSEHLYATCTKLLILEIINFILRTLV